MRPASSCRMRRASSCCMPARTISTAASHQKSIASDFDKFSQLIHTSLPATRIVVIGLKPSLLRWKLRDGMHQTNKLIRTRCAADGKCTYVDPWPSMIGKDGTPKPESSSKTACT